MNIPRQTGNHRGSGHLHPGRGSEGYSDRAEIGGDPDGSGADPQEAG